MGKNINRASLIKSGLAVLTTVSICIATLLVLRPWSANHTAQMVQHGVAPLSATLDDSGPETTQAAASGKKSAQRKADKRTAKLGPVPLPERSGSVPLPEKRDGVASTTLASAATEPQPAGAPAMPAPEGRLSKAEGDAALAPLLSYPVSDTELANLKQFIKHTYSSDFEDARSVMERLSDPVVKKFALWYYYRAEAPGTSAAEISAFLADNPLWPNRDKLEESIEDALFWREPDPRKVLAHFQERRPVSGTGKAALGSALVSIGRTDEGSDLIREAWRRHLLTPAIEKKLRKLHNSVLRAEDHFSRADYLLVQDNKKRLSAVRNLLPLIDSGKRPAIKARIAAVERSKRAGQLLSKLDKRTRLEPGVLLARIQWLRRADKDKKVWSLLRSAPKSSATLVDPGQWWVERAVQVRRALNEGNPKTAYALAKEHGGGLDEDSLSDAEFLSGWIALRFLDRPEDARRHFLISASAGGLPKRRARASYWVGRAELALRNEGAATTRFAEAAQHSHTFYGQLAHQMIAATEAKAALRTFVHPNEAEIGEFVELDVMKAIVIAQKAGLDNLLPVFIYSLARNLDSAPSMILLCELAIRVAPRHQAIRMAKVAMNRDFPVEDYAYPGALPDFKALGGEQDIETALIHALTRQESEFNPNIVSSAGAVGLMQLLPSTAKEVARTFDVKYEKDKLSKDPAYNVSLGTAFLYRLIRNYDGSYIMALAGYNAGPGRVRQWVRTFGDPRKQDVDPIDWIERIPFTETREYVHKILESAQIYRSRLDQDPARLQLAEDLHRGRKDKPIFMFGAAASN